MNPAKVLKLDILAIAKFILLRRLHCDLEPLLALFPIFVRILHHFNQRLDIKLIILLSIGIRGVDNEMIDIFECLKDNIIEHILVLFVLFLVLQNQVLQARKVSIELMQVDHNQLFMRHKRRKRLFHIARYIEFLFLRLQMRLDQLQQFLLHRACILFDMLDLRRLLLHRYPSDHTIEIVHISEPLLKVHRVSDGNNRLDANPMMPANKQVLSFFFVFTDPLAIKATQCLAMIIAIVIQHEHHSLIACKLHRYLPLRRRRSGRAKSNDNLRNRHFLIHPGIKRTFHSSMVLVPTISIILDPAQ
mmetsp:Transcript_14306/g.22353  ORF Transcript_14306/g.22353 Transcript_14306/m.22353 type:complete len:303 (+) Transcript_14306:597-1505(+)